MYGAAPRRTPIDIRPRRVLGVLLLCSADSVEDSTDDRGRPATGIPRKPPRVTVNRRHRRGPPRFLSSTARDGPRSDGDRTRCLGDPAAAAREDRGGVCGASSDADGPPPWDDDDNDDDDECESFVDCNSSLDSFATIDRVRDDRAAADDGPLQEAARRRPDNTWCGIL